MTAWRRPQGAPVLVVDGPGRRILGDVRRALPGPPRDVLVSADPWALAAAVHDVTDDGADFLAAVGGDRAWFAVAAGTQGHDGILVGHAGGRASLPRCYGSTGDAESCAPALRDGLRIPLDTMRITRRDREPIEVVNSIWWGFGHVAGLLAGGRGRWRFGLRAAGLWPFREDVDMRMGGVTRTHRASGLLIANGEYVDDLDVAPRAHPGDGKLEVLVFDGPARAVWRMLGRMPGGGHLPHPGVREYRPAEVSVSGSGRLYADGVEVGRLPAHIGVVAGRLAFAV